MPSANPAQCVILGAGGHARVLIECLLLSRSAEPVAVLDADQSLWGQTILGAPIRGGDELLGQLLTEGVRSFIIGLGGIGDNRPRQRLFKRARAAGLSPLVVRHPSVICSELAMIGAGSVLYPASVVNAGAALGQNVIVNTGAIVEHDCAVGDHVHIATGAKLGGSVEVGSLAHIGIGATVRQGVRVGEGAIVGAGAVVVAEVEPWTVVTGVPARLRQPAATSHTPVSSLDKARM